MLENNDTIIKLSGNFDNGKLVRDGLLKISNIFSEGGMFSTRRSSTIKITPSSNIKNIIIENIKNLELRDKRAKEIARTQSSSRSYSSRYTSAAAPNYTHCGANDTCYQLVKFKKSGAAIVQCTKGLSTGQEKCLSFKKSTGKYASGCGMSDSFAHHYTLEKAGNTACEY